MKTVQPLFISAYQIQNKMQIVNSYEYYDSHNSRVYLKKRMVFAIKKFKMIVVRIDF